MQKETQRKLFILLLLLLLPAIVTAQSQSGNRYVITAITHVTVIDATGAPPAQTDMTVVIEGERIVTIDRTNNVRLPRDTQVINATGKFLIPGLWDMHAHPHLNSRQYFPLFALNLYLVNGVTGLRDTFGPLETQQQWRKAIEVGAILAPRMFLAGPLLDGPKPAFAGSIAISNAEEGRQAVISLKRRGADFVKVYDLLPREAYFAIADEAKKQGIPFAGHVPATVTAAEASDAGQRSIEHLTNVAVSCSTNQVELQKALTIGLLKEDNSDAIRDLTVTETQALNTYDPERCATLAQRFVKNDTWHDPTLVTLRVNAFINDESFLNDPRLRYIPRALREEWNPKNSEFSKALTVEEIAAAKRAFPTFLKIVGDMHRAKVQFLTGTDAPAVPYCFPGFSVHDEMALFVEAGLSPMEALQTATRNPAKYLGLLDSLGTIEKGKIADLVLLDANPLSNIHNTQKIDTVIVRGKLVTRETRQRMLAEMEAAAEK